MIAECEGCGALVGDEGVDPGNVVEETEALGWVESWVGWYCPACAAERL